MLTPAWGPTPHDSESYLTVTSHTQSKATSLTHLPSNAVPVSATILGSFYLLGTKLQLCTSHHAQSLLLAERYPGQPSTLGSGLLLLLMLRTLGGGTKGFHSIKSTQHNDGDYQGLN